MNIDFIDFANEYIEKNIPGVKLVPTEGTYLIWLDFNGRGIDAKKIDDL